jgi:predicted ATP-grasp superfamily ATP-dependent carboligase
MINGGLGAVRCLGERGVDVVAVDNTLDMPTMRTRLAKHKRALPLASDELVDGLLELGRELSQPAFLLPTKRLPTLVVSEHRDRLAPFYRFSMPPHETVVALENKEHLVPLARDAGVPLPKSRVVRELRDLDDAETLRFPCILKPRDNDPVYMARFRKAYVLSDLEQAKAQCAEILQHYQGLVLQEYIPGGDDAIFFCLQYRPRLADSPPISFVGRKLVLWPPGTGASVVCTGVDEDVRAHLEATTSAFFDAVGVIGFCSIEYKRDTSSGLFYMIEPTVGRLDQLEEVAAINGVNLPYAGYCDAFGLAIDSLRPGRAQRLLVDSERLRYARQAARASRTPLADFPRWRGVDTHFRWHDPLPALDRLWRLVRGRLGRR